MTYIIHRAAMDEDERRKWRSVIGALMPFGREGLSREKLAQGARLTYEE